MGIEPVQVHIGLFPEDNGEITYEIYSNFQEDGAESIIHCQGSAVLSAVPEMPSFLDIKILQAAYGENTLSSLEVYETLRVMGIEYGRGYQGIEKVYAGPGQILAKLSLPNSISDTQDQFYLHPSLMESALQGSICLMMSAGDYQPSLPFALQELEVQGKCASTMWALVRYSDYSTTGEQLNGSAGGRKLDIDLCDDQGTVCVRMKGLTFMPHHHH